MAGIKVALGQFASTDDADSNLNQIEAQIAEAAAAGAKLIAFHELATTTYFCFEDRNAARFDLAETIPGPSTERIEKAAAAHGMHVVFPLYEAVGDVPLQHRHIHRPVSWSADDLSEVTRADLAAPEGTTRRGRGVVFLTRRYGIQCMGDLARPERRIRDLL